jgi:exopolyphosphatase/guanosine-5'-triphosphate,3'-diphosphate pyrophosphatase
MNAAERFGYMRAHSEHVARLALAAFDGTALLGMHAGDPAERELLWAAAILHDVGVLVDYSAHQRHSEYLVLNTGLPGFDHRQLAIIAALVRGHRKGAPTLEPFGAITRPGDGEIVARGGAVLRLAEQLDRSRAGEVRDLVCRRVDGALEIGLVCHGDPSLALWSAEREAAAVERAFGLPLRLTAARTRVTHPPV